MVRGERPEVDRAALADVLTGAATALRTSPRPAEHRDAAPSRPHAGATAPTARPTRRRRPADRRSRDRRPDRRPAWPRSGIDIGGTKVAGGVVAPDGTILAPPGGRPRAPRSSDTEDAIAAVVEELRPGTTASCVGVGVGAAGWFDRTGDTVLFSPHLAWRNQPLRKDLADRLQRPLWVGNDANAAAWAEYRYGAGPRQPTWR